MLQSLGHLVVTVAVVTTVVEGMIVVALLAITAAGVVAPSQLVHLWTANARITVSKAAHAIAKHTKYSSLIHVQLPSYSCTARRLILLQRSFATYSVPTRRIGIALTLETHKRVQFQRSLQQQSRHKSWVRFLCHNLSHTHLPQSL